MSIKAILNTQNGQELARWTADHPSEMWHATRLISELDISRSVASDLAAVPEAKIERIIKVILENPDIMGDVKKYWSESDKTNRASIIAGVENSLKDKIDEAGFWVGLVFGVLVALLTLIVAIVGLVVLVTAASAGAMIMAISGLVLAVIAALGAFAYGLLSIIGRLMPENAPEILSVGLDMMGNTWGDAFADPVTAFSDKVIGFQVRHGYRLDAIGLLYKTKQGEIWRGHGGAGGGFTEQKFWNDEFITAITCTTDGPVSSVLIHTNRTSYGPYGRVTNNEKTLIPRFGTKVLGLVGRSGQYVDAIGLMSNIYGSNYYGGNGGSFFLDDWDDDTAPEHRISDIVIYHNDIIRGVQVMHRHPDGSVHPETLHGSRQGNMTMLKLEPGDKITKISGRCGSRVDRLTITTERQGEKTWGGDGGSPFEIIIPREKVFTGFWGRCGSDLDAIGITWADAK